MNQILTTEKKKKNARKPVEIKGIVIFFAIAIIVFAVVLIGEGAYAIYQKAQENNPKNMPAVTITSEGDKAMILVANVIEINKIIYSWNQGETTEIPEGTTEVTEQIVLPNGNNVLNLVVEDVNGKRFSYQKEFNLEGVDITKPTIQIANTNGKITITATDETEISYLSYYWQDDEGEPTIIDATEEMQTEIKKEIELKPGTNTLIVVAEDTSGNSEEIQKEIIATTAKPKVTLMTNGADLIVEIEDKDGIQEVEININGLVKSAKNINQNHIKAGPVTLQEGNNTIFIKVTNKSGYTGSITKELQYTP